MLCKGIKISLHLFFAKAWRTEQLAITEPSLWSYLFDIADWRAQSLLFSA